MPSTGRGWPPSWTAPGWKAALRWQSTNRQSRMWENLVGRSLPFWQHFYPRLQEIFPQLAGVPLEKFYKGINKVQPSFIRVEADEATYNLHIMLRLEMEIALLEGKVAVKDLPELWNAKMQEYLGVTPPNDAKGVLQDIHWSGGIDRLFLHLCPRQPDLGPAVGEDQPGSSRPGGADPPG